ncbi:inositol monophosphatase family protein [Paenibacillus cymbidii]|uniref:inositol monophosphatase family protein n=1 Tax=Paenibacillus cymbidii TaxID=1639034 RepID=UPI001F3110F7|nr:inositol monophosphatase [Paenibacillus cymbidii]
MADVEREDKAALLRRAEEVAVLAARAAGAVARERFGTQTQVRSKGDDGDLVTEVDFLAEQELLPRLAAAFPGHQIRSEESGWSGVGGDWLWLVDPLDGTNNYAIGLPVFGVSLTLLYQNEPVLGVIYDSMLDRVYVARKDGGARCNGEPLSAHGGAGLPGRLTLGWIQGHHVQKLGNAMRLKTHLDATSKRVLRLWAPSLLWCMLARGDLDGIVLYNSEGDDLYAGVLMAREAGAVVTDFAGRPFVGMNPEPYIIACRPQLHDELMALVRAGLAQEN